MYLHRFLWENLHVRIVKNIIKFISVEYFLCQLNEIRVFLRLELLEPFLGTQ